MQAFSNQFTSTWILAMILPDYSTGIASSSVEAGLKICQDKGYTYAGLQNSNEVYVSVFDGKADSFSVAEALLL